MQMGTKLCLRCGTSDRDATGRCRLCRRNYMREYFAKRYANNPLDQKVRSAKWYLKNTERERVKSRKKHAASRDTRNAVIAAWKKKNPELHASYEAKRRAIKFNATPAWANEFFIKEAYALARLRTKMFGFKWHVDHTVPLNSKLVCGLHVETNLQVLPAVKNLAKSNTTWPFQP